MGAGLSTTLSLMSLAVAAAVGLTQLAKWVNELKDRRALRRDNETKSQAERDSIMIKGAEGVVLMMQGMLETTQASEKELRQENLDLRRRCHALEAENGGLRIRLDTLEKIRKGETSG